jgi:hypothetical protein
VEKADVINHITDLNLDTITGRKSKQWENMHFTYSSHQWVTLWLLASLANSSKFIAQAEEKINQCINVPLDPEAQIDTICGAGVDVTFDKLISALGHIAAQKPKPLIDSLMLWRKNKSDAASEARNQLIQVQIFYGFA